MKEGHRHDVLARERAHHDRWAGTIDTSRINVAAAFEGSTSPENRFILDKLSPLPGKRLLELGTGAGEASAYFALRGCDCVATDLSTGMLKCCAELAKRHGVSVEICACHAEILPFPDESFDVVYAANLLHHVNPVRVLEEMQRVLKPGGQACFWDPLRHNPIINVYRRMASEVRSEDENPLDIRVVDQVRRLFSRVEFDTFWFATLWLFLRFYLVERVDPNQERYWKKIVDEEPRLRHGYRRLERIDRIVKKLPWMRRFAWNIAVVATK